MQKENPSSLFKILLLFSIVIHERKRYIFAVALGREVLRIMHVSSAEHVSADVDSSISFLLGTR